jgi:hypothetical protein
MKRDAISFRIDDDGAKSVRPDLMFALQNFSAVYARGFHCIVETAFHGKINERPVLRGLILTACAITAPGRDNSMNSVPRAAKVRIQILLLTFCSPRCLKQRNKI